MGLSERDRERLADIVELQPTKNATLQERWGMESGSEVHAYLEEALGEYYFRDENSLIRATPEAAELVDVKPGVEEDEDALVLRVPDLERTLIEVLPGPDERSISVVAALHRVRELEAGDEATDRTLDVDDVRDALGALRRKGAVEVTYRVVPTYGLARTRDELTVEPVTAGA